MKLFQRRARSIPKAHHCTSAVSIHDHVHANDSHCTIIVQAETMRSRNYISSQYESADVDVAGLSNCSLSCIKDDDRLLI